MSAADCRAQDGLSSKVVMLRANTPSPDDAIVRFVAENAQDAGFSEREWPALATISARDALTTLCGSASPALVEQYTRLNKAVTGLPGTDQPLEAAAYTVRFPACLYVTSAGPDGVSVPVTLRPGDNKWNLTRNLFGKSVSLNNVRQVFKGSGLSDLRMQPGQALEMPFSLQVAVRPVALAPDKFVAELNRLSAGTIAAGAPVLGGALVAPVETEGVCLAASAQAPHYPQDGAAIDRAFKFAAGLRAQSALVNNVRVAILDNGFFGVPRTEPPLWGARFPETMFEGARYRRGRLGPMITGAYHPINYYNAAPANVPGITTGHGTHVAALITGGAAFDKMPDVWRMPWLKLAIINLTGGGRDFAEGVDQNAFTLLSQTRDINIVNMSIGAPKERAAELIRLPKNPVWAHTLFITAAGNEYEPGQASLPLYPALLGGAKTANVITVGSVDADHSMSSFSDRGAYVDLLAPGCRLTAPISLDENREITGTSQATALVSGTAAMLSAIWDAEPSDLKRRLLVSGRLLPRAADRDAIFGRVELDTVAALMIRHDLVTFVQDGVARTFLGRLNTLDGLTCANGAAPAWNDVRAIKSSGAHREIFIVSEADGSFSACETGASGLPSTISFRKDYELVDGAATPVSGGTFGDYPIGTVDAIIKRELEFTGE